MRPVRRGYSPQDGDFEPYKNAQAELVSRFGMYCSYCERRIPTMLAVEHIQPKDLYPELRGRWHNFLLGCSNCNSSKGAKNFHLGELFLVDRDNTALLFDYTQDGRIVLRESTLADPVRRIMATATLALTGLDKVPATTFDSNERIVALDRVKQRMECWLHAEDARNSISSQPENDLLRQMVVQLALSMGFFSIWMQAFATDVDMRLRFINSFPGTAPSACFDLTTGQLVSPAPNPDELPFGAKV